MLLGVYNFGSIDKLIKTQTTVKAPKLTKTANQAKTFDITVKNKKTKKPIKNLSLKIKIGKKVYTVKTNSKGVAKFNTKSLKVGTYKLIIYSGNIKYFVSAKSTIVIKKAPAKTNTTKTNTTETNATVNTTNTNASNPSNGTVNGKDLNNISDNASVNVTDSDNLLAIDVSDIETSKTIDILLGTKTQ